VDVHAPHQPIHTWKDFWIHLATITVGLLIAIGLEQSVEGLHRLHQRHQLEEDLRAEARKNLATMDGDYKYIDYEMVYFSAYRKNVDTMRDSGGKIKLPYRSFHPPDGVVNMTMPSSSAWTTAQQSELTALLPREEAKMYDRVYYELKTYEQVNERRVESVDEQLDFEARFAQVTIAPYEPDLSLMSKDQLDQLSAILSTELVVYRQLRNRLDIFYAAENEVANGGMSEDVVLDAIKTRLEANRPKPQPPAAPAH
jgi:hypothetical protein